MRKRGFEIVKKYQKANLTLPKRATKLSAGYDIQAAEDIVVPSFWQVGVAYALKALKQKEKKIEIDALKEEIFKPTLVPTGLKVYMQEDEYLQITSRSSNPFKRRLVLPNGVGIIDSDYYNNEFNEGELFVQLLNYGLRDVHIKKGERIAQGIFLQFLKTDDDDVSEAQSRTGGYGSTGK